MGQETTEATTRGDMGAPGRRDHAPRWRFHLDTANPCGTQALGLWYSLPEVFRQGSFVVHVWFPPREHGGPHVHVWCPEGRVVIQLVPVIRVLKVAADIKRATVREILEAVADRVDECIAEWRKHHG